METKPDNNLGRWTLDVGRWMLSKKSKVQGLKSKFSPPKSAVCSLRSAVASPGFTLIELLVAMAILMIIVLMLANLFQASTRSWDTGMRQAEIGLEARAAISLIEQDLNQAVASSNMLFSATGGTLAFYMFVRNPTNDTAVEHVRYAGGGSGLTRNGVQLLGTGIDDFAVSVPGVGSVNNSPELPDLVEIALTMSSSRNFSEARVYVQGRKYEEGGTDWIDTHRD